MFLFVIECQGVLTYDTKYFSVLTSFHPVVFLRSDGVTVRAGITYANTKKIRVPFFPSLML